MKSKNTRYSEEFKNQIVKEVEEVRNANLVARNQTKVPGTVTRWVREPKIKDIVITLKRALMKRNLCNKETGLVIRSDNGP
ncbi:transposase [Anaerosalibacter massiliensis]|uniref:Transposase n=1 Tax=Anaerosalibacter massiliensis TaxID=1347392 RepID=A0A9X2MHV4_9FIRM|nr:transposase [Anaerosalibacter massiliensis]MCR2044313.1 transposase [Anaerosalibacter massiliensis]